MQWRQPSWNLGGGHMECRTSRLDIQSECQIIGANSLRLKRTKLPILGGIWQATWKWPYRLSFLPDFSSESFSRVTLCPDFWHLLLLLLLLLLWGGGTLWPQVTSYNSHSAWLRHFQSKNPAKFKPKSGKDTKIGKDSCKSYRWRREAVTVSPPLHPPPPIIQLKCW